MISGGAARLNPPRQAGTANGSRAAATCHACSWSGRYPTRMRWQGLVAITSVRYGPMAVTRHLDPRRGAKAVSTDSRSPGPAR